MDPRELDPVNHPAHYTKTSVQVIEVTRHLDFCRGNAFKYIARCDHKGERKQDLEKAYWYLSHCLANGLFVDELETRLMTPQVLDLSIEQKSPDLGAALRLIWNGSERALVTARAMVSLRLSIEALAEYNEEPHRDDPED